MTNNDCVLADSIAHLPHLQAFDLMAKKRLEDLAGELSKILVYSIDTVDASALPYLAAQFDVLGFNGYQLATTDDQRRAVIKNGITLHRYKGTPWAVRTALETIGYTNIVITEHVGHWARFTITLSTSATLTPNTASDITKMVTAFKNTRSHLESIQVNWDVTDYLTFVSETTFMDESWHVNDVLQLTGTLKYDGTGLYNGTYQHNGDSDSVAWTTP